MSIIKNFKFLFILVLLASFFVATPIVGAGAGSRLQACLDKPDEGQKDLCIRTFEEFARQECIGQSDQATCKTNYLLAQAGVTAGSRWDACSDLQGWEVSACQDGVNTQAFMACASNPNPGQCAEDFRNAPADGSSGAAAAGGAAVESERARNTCKDRPLTADNCPLLKEYVIPAINALSGAVGIVIVIMVVWSGIQYTSSRDNPQQAAQAKEHIRNAILALVVYIFMIAFLNWVVPGGVFNA